MAIQPRPAIMFSVQNGVSTSTPALAHCGKCEKKKCKEGCDCKKCKKRFRADHLQPGTERCPECGAICIHRQGYSIRNLMDGRKCRTCGYELAVIV
mgnify:CR=1 FL=1